LAAVDDEPTRPGGNMGGMFLLMAAMLVLILYGSQFPEESRLEGKQRLQSIIVWRGVTLRRRRQHVAVDFSIPFRQLTVY
jgi:hypothetical protein